MHGWRKSINGVLWGGSLMRATSILKEALQMKCYIPVFSSFGASRNHSGVTMSLQLIIIYCQLSVFGFYVTSSIPH